MTATTAPSYIEFRDDRTAGAPLTLDPTAWFAVCDAVGLDVTAKPMHLRVVLFDGETSSTSRLPATIPLTPDVAPLPAYEVRIACRPKDEWNDRRLYPVNNSLLHELRHVVQMHLLGMTDLDYSRQVATYGYRRCPSEVDARAHGRLAWHGDPSEKPTAAGDHRGRDAWLLLPPSDLADVEFRRITEGLL